MSLERKLELHLEIAHVLFIDVVGFSKRGRPVSPVDRALLPAADSAGASAHPRPRAAFAGGPAPGARAHGRVI